jgi:NADPH-dependent 2,4-dienoyl-CoA reductase/sulfur reductase-like enzyme
MRVTKPGITSATQETSITFEGHDVAARRGESVAAALVNAGYLGLRVTNSGAERGVFCGMGVCSDCAVTIDGQPGRLACMTKVESGMRVQKNPPLRPVDVESRGLVNEEVIDCEILVIGAGPAGLHAALSAARRGAQVVVVDERAALGGQYFKQPGGHFEVDDEKIDHQYREGRQLIHALENAGVQFRLGTRVWGATPGAQVYATSVDRRLVLRARSLILASGAYERGVPFPGWTLPGVMTTGAAQTLLRSYLIAAGSRILVSGNGPLNLQVAAELTRAHVDVVAVAETASLWRPSNAGHLARMMAAAPAYGREGLAYVADLFRAKVPILARSAIVEARGEGRVEVAVVAKLDQTGHAIAGTEKTFDVDSVSLGFGFIASSELARSLGCAHHVDDASGSVVVDRDRSGRTSVEGVWVIGDGASVMGAQVAQSVGKLAGADAARFVTASEGAADSRETARAVRILTRQERFQRSLWRQFSGPRLVDQLATPSTIICRCEEVTLAEIDASLQSWLGSAGSLKRVTRAGMGKCQGRYCSPILTELAARATGVAIDGLSGFIPQAPFLPTSAEMLARGGTLSEDPLAH